MESYKIVIVLKKFAIDLGSEGGSSFLHMGSNLKVKQTKTLKSNGPKHAGRAN